jgi:acetyl-CoA carboxylase carboxyl transferase subunit beta
MNWLTNYVKPKLHGAFKRSDAPDNLWHKCEGCGHLIFLKEYVANQHVCAKCGHHGRIGPAERFAKLFNNGEAAQIAMPKSKDDPVKFKDKKRYSDRLREARAKTGADDALQAAFGTIGGLKAVVAVQNFFFMAGSMGVGVGDAFVTAARAALKKNAPFIIFTSAGGARMQEGIMSLMQLPRTTVVVDELREAGLPYIVVLTDPTTGGVTASFGMLGDVQLAEPGALIGFAGPRVIENTIREKLPEGFQRAEYLLAHGMVDMVVHRHHMRETLIRLLSLLTHDGKLLARRRHAA